MPFARAPFARVTVALLGWAGGCELIVDGRLDVVHCADEGAVGPPACFDGSQCRGGLCVPVRMGAACAADDECDPGAVCVDLSLADGPRGARCTRPCCTSSDCDPDRGFVCTPARSGAGSFCVAAADLGRAVGGALRAGEACASDAECRSGACAAGSCADTCCESASCAAGEGVCRLQGGPGGEAFRCATRAEEKLPRYASCTEDAQCASGLCLPVAPEETRRCVTACCGSAECESLPDKGRPVMCAPVRVGSSWVRACSVLGAAAGVGEIGSPCVQAADCRSGVCEGPPDGEGRCSDTCCTDASCGDAAAFACRPVSADGAWALRCEAR